MSEPLNHTTHEPILKGLLADLDGRDAPLTACACGSHMVAVTCGTVTGLASCEGDHGPGAAPAPELGELPSSGLELAGWLASPPPFTPQARSLGLAALNALLPEPAAPSTAKGQDLILERGRGRHVAVVGHFPFVERLGEAFASLSVLELAPREGDLPASRADEVLPKADVVAITGTTLMNGTLAGLLDLCRDDAFTLLLGPSTPFAPSLFERGVSVLAGARVDDADQAMAGIRAGRPFRGLGGVRPLIWTKS